MTPRSRICALALTVLLLPVAYQEHWSTLPEKAFYLNFPPTQTYLEQPLSPYDALLQKYAEGIGWDWRLVAAVVYHESRFHEQAQSGKGAVGLMQIRSTRYPQEELLIPERNLQVGTRYLKKLQGMFPAASPLENIKFTLAAYNLGEGRLGQLISRAREKGLNPDYWDSVGSQLPKGHHTLSYVENVLNTYDLYAKQYPPCQ